MPYFMLKSGDWEASTWEVIPWKEPQSLPAIGFPAESKRHAVICVARSIRSR